MLCDLYMNYNQLMKKINISLPTTISLKYAKNDMRKVRHEKYRSIIRNIYIYINLHRAKFNN